MAYAQVTRIRKIAPGNHHEHISHIGDPNANWFITREEAISFIDKKVHTFYVVDPYNGKRANVGVVRPAGRAPYLRTYADNDWNDNLLSLPQS